MNQLIRISLTAVMATVSAGTLAANEGMATDKTTDMGRMMDTNKDGMVSKKEFMDYQEVMWKQLAKNKDDLVMMKDMHMMNDTIKK